MQNALPLIGAPVVTLPGPDVYSALESGAIEAADWRWALDQRMASASRTVSNYIIMGPVSTPCLHQPVDLMEFSFNLQAWNGLSDHLKALLTDEVRVLSMQHFTAIQQSEH